MREALEGEEVSRESELVLTATKHLRDARGEHPESVEVKEELARRFLEAQAMLAEQLRENAIQASKIVELEHIVKACGAV